MKDFMRYWWNWLLAQTGFFTIIFSVVMGFAIGVLVYDVRRGRISDSLLVSLQAECRSYFGHKAALVYNDGKFLCLPERR